MRANRFGRILAVLMAMCMILATAVFAAETGMLWISLVPSEDGTATTAMILTDTTVTDGLVKVTYDAEKLTYTDLTVNGDYVAMYAINADTEGELVISWVAPEVYDCDGQALTLMEVQFQGGDAGQVLLTGVAHDAQGNEIPIGDVDTSALEDAIAQVEALNELSYTQESWAALTEALEKAKEVLADPTATQAEVDEAAEALLSAMDALVEYVPADKSALEEAIAKAEALKEGDYTAESWAAVAEALENAKAVLDDHWASQENVDAAAKALTDAMNALAKKPIDNSGSTGSGDSPDTGDHTMIGLLTVVTLLSAAAMAVLIVLRNKNKQGR